MVCADNAAGCMKLSIMSGMLNLWQSRKQMHFSYLLLTTHDNVESECFYHCFNLSIVLLLNGPVPARFNIFKLGANSSNRLQITTTFQLSLALLHPLSEVTAVSISPCFFFNPF